MYPAFRLRGKAYLWAGRGKCELGPVTRVTVPSKLLLLVLGSLTLEIYSGPVGGKLIQAYGDEVLPTDSIQL